MPSPDIGPPSISCEQPSERNDGTLCGNNFQVSIVDVVRHEDDGSATFFTLPLCYGHRLALGEYVVHYEPIEVPDVG